MSKEKLKLNDLKLKGIATELDEKEKSDVKGGRGVFRMQKKIDFINWTSVDIREPKNSG